MVGSETDQGQISSDYRSILYEVMCWNGCFEIEINDQGREVVNEVCKQLHELTGEEQRGTSAYDSQANDNKELFGKSFGR